MSTFLLGVCTGVLLVLGLRFLLPLFKRDKVVSATMEEVEGTYEYLITIKRESGKVRQYRGGGTVWHAYPSGRRCEILMESWLCDIWQREKWKMEND